MGAGQSRGAADGDADFETGVRITQGLLEQLEGKPRAQRAPRRGAGFAGGPPGFGGAEALRPPLGGSGGGEGDAAAGDAALIRADRSLSRALERSRRVGGLLLKAEEEELARVGQLADELAASEYVAPSRPRPCTRQAEECVRCYAEHAADPLACAAAVDAYGRCAKEAWGEAAARAAAA